jgi:predicted dinucleotide-binding enzyme
MRQVENMNGNRRQFLATLGAAAAGLGLVGLRGIALAAATGNAQSMKIGVIGSGRLGGTVGSLWVKAGHQVMFSGLDLEEVRRVAAGLGPNAQAGTPLEAARFGDVILTAVPYSAIPQLGKDLAQVLKGKIVLDASNPAPRRDGDMAVAALAKGAGIASAEFLPGVRLVRAFNSVNFEALRKEAHRAGERVAVPLAADDEAALNTAVRLVRDAGFEPVIVGALSRARQFDSGTPVFGKALTAKELRSALGTGS